MTSSHPLQIILGLCILPGFLVLAGKESDFAVFLSRFPESTMPINLNMTSDPVLLEEATAKYKKIPYEFSKKFLSENLSNLSTEGDLPVIGYFNMPNFKNAYYYYVNRLTLSDSFYSILVFIEQDFVKYYGLIIFSIEGDFIDHLFLAGREGGSQVLITLVSLIKSKNDITQTLNIEDGDYNQVKVYKYSILDDGKIKEVQIK